MKFLDSLLKRKPDVARMKARRDIPRLLKTLQDPSYSYSARKALEELRPQEAVEPLIGLLSRQDLGWKRAAILELLGALGDARAFQPLVATLEDPEWGGTAAKALGQLGDRRAIEPLLRALGTENRNRELRDGAAEALASLEELRAIQPLVQGLSVRLSHHKPDAIYKALKHLAEKAPDQVLFALTHAIESEQEWWRWAAAEALVYLGEKASDALLNAVGNRDASVQRIAVEELLRRKDPRLRARMEVVLSEGPPDEYLLSVYQKLGGDLLVPLSVAAKRSTYGRLVAARLLGNCGTRGLPLLVNLLKDEDRDIRNTAIESLINRGYIQEVIPALLDSRTSSFVQETLLRAKHTAASSLVFPFLIDRESPARREAASILCENTAAGRLGSLDRTRLTDAMLEALSEDDEHMRYMAAETLGWLGDPRAIPYLEAFLADQRNSNNLSLMGRGTKALERLRKVA